ncbi:MAG: putative DNA modification/repair radical SAM protein [Gemmatimonadota bacterium]|nr:putative DNA modification/repair radical SAM protein [Gemmatimonadota bacterium]
MDIKEKLAVLADAAKYDASCSSSGSKGRQSKDGKGLGSTEGMGICHSYTPDGRCVSLLKVLLTNYCQYDCLYCINRRSSNVRRARFSVEEVVRVTVDFYRRNYIEGLFLSSGIFKSPDHTMEQVVRVARTLRVEERFHGYIHLKTIPLASPELVREAGRWADRLSVNVELPTQGDLDRLAPEKSLVTIRRAMTSIRDRIDETRDETRSTVRAARDAGEPIIRSAAAASPTIFAPAGQSTQLIVGATSASDASILATSRDLYDAHKLRRVYYSAFSPIPDSPDILPSASPPLVREHRLYQADWLVRFYGFQASELTTPSEPNLDLQLDPKMTWALRNRGLFPVDVNSAARQLLLRIPGVGARSVDRMLAARRWHKLRLADLLRLKVAMTRALPFILAADHNPATRSLDVADLRTRLLGRRTQLDLFSAPLSAVSGEL